MKKITRIFTLILISSLLPLSACTNQVNVPPIDTLNLVTTKTFEFIENIPDSIIVSDGWENGNGQLFDVAWTSSNAKIIDNSLELSITNKIFIDSYNSHYFGGEIQSQKRYHYGDYSVKMKPAKQVGIVTSFFVYTYNPWDEIDIEFLGKDTSKVQFNYYINGKGKNEVIYDLGFDASLEFHEYGFRWAQDYIIWFVDGKPVHIAYESPNTPAAIMANMWCGTKKLKNWLGTFTGATDATKSYYMWMGCTTEPTGDYYHEG